MCHVDGSIGLLLKSTPVMLCFNSFSPPLIKCLQIYSSPFVNKCSMKSHLLAKKRRREDLNLALCWTVSVTVSLCWTSTNIISICNILYLQCIKWLQFCTVKVRYLGCTRGRFLLRRAKTSSCLPKSCQVMKTTLQQGWPGILCQQRRQIFQQVQSCFHLSCQPGYWLPVVFD